MAISLKRHGLWHLFHRRIDDYHHHHQRISEHPTLSSTQSVNQTLNLSDVFSLFCSWHLARQTDSVADQRGVLSDDESFVVSHLVFVAANSLRRVPDRRQPRRRLRFDDIDAKTGSSIALPRPTAATTSVWRHLSAAIGRSLAECRDEDRVTSKDILSASWLICK